MANPVEGRDTEPYWKYYEEDDYKALEAQLVKWRPIETAPKDGTDIIVGFDAASVWVVHVAFWREVTEELMSYTDFTPEDTGWWSYVRGSVTQEQLDGYRMPTHWIELPDVPGYENAPAAAAKPRS
jgi:hypothetical protein